MRISGPRDGMPVVLEPGLGASSVGWSRLHARLAELTRVVSYDRAGLGMSPPVPGYRRPAPRLGLVCLIGLTLAPVVPHAERAGARDNHLLGELRLWTVVLVAAVMLALPRRRYSG